MNHEDLFEAIGSADERMLEKSEHKSYHWEEGFLGAVAACLVVAITAGIFFLPHLRRRPSDSLMGTLGSDKGNVDVLDPTDPQADGRYLRIHLSNADSEEALAKYVSEDTVVVGNTLKGNQTQLPIYQIKERTITEQEVRNVMEKLEILGIATNIPCWKLEDNVFTGTLGSFGIDVFTKSDEELETMARKVFEQLDFLDEEYEYHGIINRTSQFDSDGNEKVLQVGIAFCRVIDGIRIIGSDVCNIWFNDSGPLKIQLELYDYEPIGTMDLVSMEDAWDRIKTPDRFSIDGEPDCTGPAKTLAVEEVVMVYCNQYYRGCTILQPVYHFKGTATFEDGTQAPFTASIIAIPESMTWVDESYIP